jgi:hypothetical protein
MPPALSAPAPGDRQKPARPPLLGFTAGPDEVPAITPTFWPTDRGGEGDSHGLMTALAYLDALTEGDLSGGQIITGTGSVSADGTVGEISEAGTKIRGAGREDADVFFVPVGDNAREARAARAGVPVVEVSSVRQAVSWLCRHGGRSPACGTVR